MASLLAGVKSWLWGSTIQKDQEQPQQQQQSSEDEDCQHAGQKRNRHQHQQQLYQEPVLREVRMHAGGIQQPGSEDAESHGAAAALTAYVALSAIAIGFFPITASDVTVTFHMLCHKADQGFSWFTSSLKVDADGDAAHDFLGEHHSSSGGTAAETSGQPSSSAAGAGSSSTDCPAGSDARRGSAPQQQGLAATTHSSQQQQQPPPQDSQQQQGQQQHRQPSQSFKLRGVRQGNLIVSSS